MVNGAAGGLCVGVLVLTPSVTFTATRPFAWLDATDDVTVWSALCPVTRGTLAAMFAEITPSLLCSTAC